MYISNNGHLIIVDVEDDFEHLKHYFYDLLCNKVSVCWQRAGLSRQKVQEAGFILLRYREKKQIRIIKDSSGTVGGENIMGVTDNKFVLETYMDFPCPKLAKPYRYNRFELMIL